MGEVNARSFGLLVAYVLPGFVALWGLGYGSDTVRSWFEGVQGTGPNAASFLFVLVGSVGAGMTASGVRWAVLDTAFSRLGIRRPAWNDVLLAERLESFESLVDNHFRYYQFYGNSTVSVVFAYCLWRNSPQSTGTPPGLLEVGLVFVIGIFIAGARDALQRYYGRTALLLGNVERSGSCDQRPSPEASPQAREPREGGGAEAEADSGEQVEHNEARTDSLSSTIPSRE